MSKKKEKKRDCCLLVQYSRYYSDLNKLVKLLHYISARFLSFRQFHNA